MSNSLDLRQLAVDREGATDRASQARGHLLTRYVAPLLLLSGFVALVAWASWEWMIPAQPVTVVPVFSTHAEMRREGAPLFQASGWVEPRPTPIRVAALAPGIVDRLLVVEDQWVESGDPVAELVKDDAQLACNRAAAAQQLRAAELLESQAVLKAAVTRLEQPVHLEAALGSAEAALAQIETSLKTLPHAARRAESDLAALESDLESKIGSVGVVAGVDIDRAQGKVESGRALVEELTERDTLLGAERRALKGRRDALQTLLKLRADEWEAKESSEARVDAAKAKLAQADVVVAEADLRLRRMTVCAPVTGRVYRLIGHPGASIGAGMTQMTGHDGSTIVTLYRPDALQVRVDVRFQDLPNVSIGQTVEINNPAIKQPLLGKVLYISSEADIQKNTLQVKVEIFSPPSIFKPEMLVDATFLANKQSDSADAANQTLKLYVPRQLIQQEAAIAFVWLADQSAGVASKAVVETGKDAANGLVEITRGLTVSSRIIATGFNDLRDGDRIRVTGEEPSFGVKNSSRATSQENPNGID